MTKKQYLRMRPGNIEKTAAFYYPEYQHRILIKGGTPMSLAKYTEKFNFWWGQDDDAGKTELTRIATEFNDDLYGIKEKK